MKLEPATKTHRQTTRAGGATAGIGGGETKKQPPALLISERRKQLPSHKRRCTVQFHQRTASQDKRGVSSTLSKPPDDGSRRTVTGITRQPGVATKMAGFKPRPTGDKENEGVRKAADDRRDVGPSFVDKLIKTKVLVPADVQKDPSGSKRRS